MHLRSLLPKCLVIATVAVSAAARAQPYDSRDRRDHRDNNARDRDRERKLPSTNPTEAPPPVREERVAPRAGFVWIPGQWEWRAGKWAWTAGRWEAERAGKRWRPSHWDQQDGAWRLTAGDWVDDDHRPPPPQPPPAVAPPLATAPPPPPASVPPDRRRDWKIDRPVVSSYWPTRGRPGTRVTIRGRNFPSDLIVLWAGEELRGAKVEPDEVTFEIPKGAKTGAIALRTSRRDLPVGAFAVADSDRPDEDARREDDQRRRDAETAWAQRQKQLAKDRAARENAVRERERERETTRERRRAQEEQDLRAKWERAFLADPDAQAELTLHAQRVADIQRMRDLAEVQNDGKLAVRIELVQKREDARHNARMKALRDAFDHGGGR